MNDPVIRSCKTLNTVGRKHSENVNFGAIFAVLTWETWQYWTPSLSNPIVRVPVIAVDHMTADQCTLT